MFFTSFYVCVEINAVRCLVTNQTVFCTTRPTKRLCLKCSFYAAVFTSFFLIEFREIMFIFAFQKHFWKKILFLFFLFTSNWYIFCVFILFWCDDIKSNFLKIKKYFQVKNTLKITATIPLPNISYMFFAIHKLQP